MASIVTAQVVFHSVYLDWVTRIGSIFKHSVCAIIQYFVFALKVNTIGSWLLSKGWLGVLTEVLWFCTHAVDWTLKSNIIGFVDLALGIQGSLIDTQLIYPCVLLLILLNLR